MRPKGTIKELQRRRQRAIALLKDGYGIRKVARMVGSSGSSVVRWRNAHKKGGAKALEPKPIPGRPKKLSDKQRQKLDRLLNKGPTAFGYKTSLWTLERIAAVIRKKFRVCYHPSQVWRILTQMGYSCQKPECRARERDEERIAIWRKSDWTRIKKSPKKV
ncbi:MAG: IS630 family transposase [Planctomycetota bacterium]|jgi:transposase